MRLTETQGQGAANEAVVALLLEAIDALPYPFSIFGADGRLLVCSRVYREKYQLALEAQDGPLIDASVAVAEVLARRFGADYTPELLERFLATGGVGEPTSLKDRKVAGRWMRQAQTVTPRGSVVDASFCIDGLIKQTLALSDAKRALEHQAYHDPLTDLPNRRALSEHMEGIMASREEGLFDIALLHVDLDKFKAVNDTLGHDAGDHVIRHAAKVLTGATRDGDLVARVGGDEFVILCHQVSSFADAGQVAQRIVERMSEPIAYGEEHCQIGASIGIVFCETPRELSDAITHADIALYEAKRAGRGCYRVFETMLKVRNTEQQQAVAAVTEAIHLGAFEPYFQPQVDAQTGALAGAEALARWIERERGVLGPAHFMSALCDMALARKLDEMILRKSIAALVGWDAEGLSIPRVAVNLSAGFLADDGAVDRIKWMVEKAGLAPGRIGIEIQEAALSDDGAAVLAQNVRALGAAGFALTLDNFGTGHASIAALKTLDVDCMKIGSRFCSGLQDDRDLRAITSAMVALGKTLEISVCCHGIETHEDWQAVAKMGAHLVQGRRVAPPMAQDVFGRWVAQTTAPKVEWLARRA